MQTIWLGKDSANVAIKYVGKDECRRDWINPSAAKLPAGQVETCIIVSESKNLDDAATGFLLNVVKFNGASFVDSKIIQKLDYN